MTNVAYYLKQIKKKTNLSYILYCSIINILQLFKCCSICIFYSFFFQ